MFQKAWNESKHFIYGSLSGLILTGVITHFQSFVRNILLLGAVDLAIFLVQLYLASHKD